jgi:hypothetical protein
MADREPRERCVAAQCSADGLGRLWAEAKVGKREVRQGSREQQQCRDAVRDLPLRVRQRKRQPLPNVQLLVLQQHPERVDGGTGV